MGTIKTTNIEPIANNGTVTLGSSGDQFTLATGAKSSFLYPAFKAYNETTQNLSDDTFTKVVFATEVFDTNNCFDNSTNYRFTPTIAGKYFVFSQLTLNSSANTSLAYCNALIYKNGSSTFDGNLNHRMDFNATANYTKSNAFTISSIIDMNGSSDYLEIFARMNVTSGTPSISNDQSQFSAYRIGS